MIIHSHRGRSQGSEMLSDFPGVTQLISGPIRYWNLKSMHLPLKVLYGVKGRVRSYIRGSHEEGLSSR